MSTTRAASVAGRFYPSGRDECLRQIDRMPAAPPIAGTVYGGIVPHAGWVYSGPTAALAYSALAAAEATTVVVFGAVHMADRSHASVYASGAWETPLGRVLIDETLAEALLQRCRELVSNPDVHACEHSIEVQVPLIQRILGDVRIVPILVRPDDHSAEIGRACGEAVAEAGNRVVFVGSTDLTHYGPPFQYEPRGHGGAGVRWAKEVNDRRMVELIARLDADAVVAEASAHHNACGAGAIAATIAACRAVGASRYVELAHTTSAERDGDLDDAVTSVGYEAGVFVSD